MGIPSQPTHLFSFQTKFVFGVHEQGFRQYIEGEGKVAVPETNCQWLGAHFLELAVHGGLWTVSKTGARRFHRKQQFFYSFQVQHLDFFFFSNTKSHPPPPPSTPQLVLDWTKPERKLGLAKLQPSAEGMLKSRKLWQSWVAEKLLELIYCGHGDRQQHLSSDGKAQKHLQNRLEKYCWSLHFDWAFVLTVTLEAFRTTFALTMRSGAYSLSLCATCALQKPRFAARALKRRGRLWRWKGCVGLGSSGSIGDGIWGKASRKHSLANSCLPPLFPWQCEKPDVRSWID